MELKKLVDKDFLKECSKLLNKSGSDKWNEINEKLEVFVKETLPKLDKSKLKPADLMGHDLRFFEYWNKFVKNKLTDSHENSLFVRDLANSLGKYVIILHNEKWTDEEFWKYAKAVGFDLMHKDCRKTGDYIVSRLNDDFEFRFEKLVKKAGGGMDFVPLETSSFKNDVKECIIEFKTGNLIINDFFRTKNNEFRDAVESKDRKDRKFDINSAKGRVESTLDYAKHNFAHVHLTNGYVGVYLVKGNLYVGDGPDREDQKKGKIFKGSICTDLWAGSIIDESNFIEILTSKGMTKKQALAELKEIKEGWTNISVKVKPGKYKLSFCGDYEDFNAKFRKKNKSLKLETKYKPYFTLEKIKD